MRLIHRTRAAAIIDRAMAMSENGHERLNREHHEMNVEAPDEASFGPAMQALNERQRLFVRAMVQFPAAKAAKLARMAGYGVVEGSSTRVMDQIGYRLVHDDKVLAAVHEETEKAIRRGGLVGIAGMIEIATDKNSPERLRACIALADRAGFPAKTEHKVVVEHTDDSRMLAFAERLAGELGIGREKLLGPNVIEGKVNGKPATIDAE